MVRGDKGGGASKRIAVDRAALGDVGETASTLGGARADVWMSSSRVVADMERIKREAMDRLRLILSSAGSRAFARLLDELESTALPALSVAWTQRTVSTLENESDVHGLTSISQIEPVRLRRPS